MNIKDLEILISSDVSDRDGIGVEVYYQNKLIIEIFRDDSTKTRSISLFEESIPLNVIENVIEIFKSNISSEYID